MKLYNTLTRKVEEFVPIDKNEVKIYTCGPTVYHYAHIGNLRTYIMEDILEKTLIFLGYKVKRAMNITDVGHLSSDSDSGEDKMLKSAKREHKSVLDIAKFYTDEFKKDTKKLNIKWPSIVSPATENIDFYIMMIEKLLADGYAYKAGGNVYFDTSKLSDYYILTNHRADEMVVGVREGVEFDSNKKNQADFVLWFTKSKFDSQELKWESPFGVGYPGWHIECSSIAIKNLGEYLDLHCGGVDNIFPHHTNEIAQSEAYLGHKWCNYWVHGEHLNDQSGNYEVAKADYNKIIELFPDYYYANECLGILQWHEGLWSEAYKNFYAAYQHNPNQPSYAFMCAACMYKAGTSSARIKKFLDPVFKNIERDSLNYYIGRLLYDMTGESDVIFRIQKENGKSQKSRALFYLGLYYELKDRKDLALKYYQEAKDVVIVPSYFEYRFVDWALKEAVN